MDNFPTYSDGSHPKVAIIGAGISGIAMSINLKQKLDIHDFIVFEGESDVGGTWHANSYPGCACDINSHLYSLYNNLNPNWSKNFSGQAEIRQYLCDTVDKFDFRQNIRFNTWVTQARFDQSVNKWKLTYKDTLSGEEHQLEVDILIGGVGYLRIPNIPKELTTFEGPWMHSAKWDPTVDLVGKRVGIIGTGASAVQIVPNIVDQVSELHTFQRSQPYVFPRGVSLHSDFFKSCLAFIPGLQFLYYWILFLLNEMMLTAFYTDSWVSKLPTWGTAKYIQSAIRDPRKRELMTPKYPFGCKRVTPSDTYYQAIDLDKVTIHDGNIDKVEGNTIYLKNGTFQAVDVLILATGFQTTSPYKDMDIANLSGEHIDECLNKVGGAPQLNYGITSTGLPNFFMLFGPTTGLAQNSVTFVVECQANYISKTIAQMMNRDIAAIELKPEIGDAYWQWVQKRVRRMVWHGNCNNWYQNANGEVIAMWPGTLTEYYFKTLRPRIDDFICTKKIE